MHHEMAPIGEEISFFYGLCVLYALCGACIIINTAIDMVDVSKNDCPRLTLR